MNLSNIALESDFETRNPRKVRPFPFPKNHFAEEGGWKIGNGIGSSSHQNNTREIGDSYERNKVWVGFNNLYANPSWGGKVVVDK